MAASPFTSAMLLALVGPAVLASTGSMCAAMGKRRIVGLNAMPGGMSLRLEKCPWCEMHRDNRYLNSREGEEDTEENRKRAQQAVRESDFLFVDQWRALDAPHLRFVGVHELENDRPEVLGRAVPKDKIAIGKNMDPYDLAGKRLFSMAPYLNVSISYSLRASVVTTFAPVGWWQKVSQLPVPRLRDKPKLMVWVSSNCRPTMTYHRDLVVQELMKHMKVESRGRCWNNAPRFEGNYGMTLSEKYQPYKFVLVMENSVEQDWVTEKFFLPFLANSVPVYFGAPNIEQYQPGPHSFINMRDFSSPAALAKRLEYLATHESEYQKFFAWRKTQPQIPPSLDRIQKLSAYRESLGCDICKCICDARCSRSANNINQYKHLEQLNPWQWHEREGKASADASGPSKAGSRGAEEGTAAIPPVGPGPGFLQFAAGGGAQHDDQFHQDYITQHAGAFGRKQGLRVSLKDGVR